MTRLLNANLSLAFRLVASTLIACVGFGLSWYLFESLGSYISCVTIFSVVSISFLLEAKFAVIFALILSLAGDYFFIPPIGGVFENFRSFEHFFVVCSACLVTAYLISSLRDSLERLSVARREAERVSQQMEKMMALVSHDVRNPLSAAKISAQLVLEGPDRTNRQTLLASVLRNLERADSLIQTLLDVSSMRMGQAIQLHYRYYDLSSDLRDIVAEMSLVNGTRLTFVASEPAWGMWGRDGIHRALENLITNALKYGDPESAVTIALVHENNDVLISVHNLGNEIKKSEQGSLFDYFHRGQATGSLKGWGLGLALVKGIAEAHGGGVRVESGSGVGTKFILTLPKRRGKTPLIQKAAL